MKIKLRSMWFAPGGVRIREGEHEDIDASLFDALPSSTEIFVDGKWVKKEELDKAPKPEPVVEDKPKATTK